MTTLRSLPQLTISALMRIYVRRAEALREVQVAS